MLMTILFGVNIGVPALDQAPRLPPINRQHSSYSHPLPSSRPSCKSTTSSHISSTPLLLLLHHKHTVKFHPRHPTSYYTPIHPTLHSSSPDPPDDQRPIHFLCDCLVLHDIHHCQPSPVITTPKQRTAPVAEWRHHSARRVQYEHREAASQPQPSTPRISSQASSIPPHTPAHTHTANTSLRLSSYCTLSSCPLLFHFTAIESPAYQLPSVQTFTPTSTPHPSSFNPSSQISTSPLPFTASPSLPTH